MNTELRTNKAFTLIELVVAIAILALVSSFAGVIFNVSIGSHRTAAANAEIMQKLRAITDQLNADLRGIRKDAPMAIQFWLVGDTRRDSIAFFANGDFQSVRQYPTAAGFRTVSGNVASIYYGRRSGPSDPNVLARKQKILTSDTSLTGSPLLSDPCEFLVDSLAVWKLGLNDANFVDWVVDSPRVDLYLYLEEDLPLYVMEGVGNFMIQMAVWNPESKVFLWFPDNDFFDLGILDINGDGIFGFFYNIPGGLITDDWSDESANWPKALKFTFTLYDSKGIIENGRTFTHIVYTGD
jgi:prepilin-type N-terminal cleavage/methylation domain-containing protein